MFSSSGEVVGHLRAMGFKCNKLPYADVVYNKSGSFTAKDTTKYFFPIISRYFQQVGYEARNIRAYSPNLVISDSAMYGVMAAKLVGTKIVTFLNQLRLESSPKTPPIFAKLLSSGSVAMGGEFWGLSDKIFIPDLPPPYTISAKSIWAAGKMLRKGEYIGFLTPKEELTMDSVTERLANDTKPKIFWQISGPPQTRGPLLAKARSLADSLYGRMTSVISCGSPGGETTPLEIRGGFLYQWCKPKDTIVRLADVVVSRAGHTSICQFIQRRKPMILVPITAQSEQEGNAQKAQSIGVAAYLKESELDLAHLEQALDEVTSQRFKRRILELSDFAARFDPISTIKGLLS